MSSPIITLTTDFGAGSAYVAAMKGVILGIHPKARIVDLCHTIPAQETRRAALLLPDIALWFPPGTIHVVVVDPSVGTNRKIIVAEIFGHLFVGPDNGVFSCLAERERPSKIVSVEDPKYWLPQVSRTFHGRDIMAPVAAHLALGLAPDQLGQPTDRLISLNWPMVNRVANRIEGEIAAIDSFGNLITNISSSSLEGVPRDDSLLIECDGHQTNGIFSTYADQPEMTLIALVDSNSHLELAIVNESAAAMLGVQVGATVSLSW